MYYVLSVIVAGVAGMVGLVFAAIFISWFVMILFKSATLGIYLGIDAFEDSKLKKTERENNGRSK